MYRTRLIILIASLVSTQLLAREPAPAAVPTLLRTVDGDLWLELRPATFAAIPRDAPFGQSNLDSRSNRVAASPLTQNNDVHPVFLGTATLRSMKPTPLRFPE